MNSQRPPSSWCLLGVVCAGALLMTSTRSLPQEPAAASGFDSQNPTPERLHQYLEASYNRSLLIGRNAEPFHLNARIDFFRLGTLGGKRLPDSSATLDEVWHDSLHWTLTVTYGEKTYKELDDGVSSYTVGELPDNDGGSGSPPSIAGLVHRLEAALFSPYPPSLLSTRRLGLMGTVPCRYRTPQGNVRNDQPDGILSCACIAAEPELRNVPSNLPLAQTTYCFDPHSLTLLHAEYPNGFDFVDNRVDLYDFASFGAKEIPRTIDIIQPGWGTMASMHITTIETATNIDASNAHSSTAPADAKLGKAHSQEDLLDNDLMRGQIIPSTFDTYASIQPLLGPPPAGSGYVVLVLKLHIDASGEVTGCEVLNGQSIMTPAVVDAVKRWKYRASYLGSHAIAVDRIERIRNVNL